MILPSKFLPADRSLIVIGGEVLQLVRQMPMTSSEAWERFRAARSKNATAVSFDWFCLALALLFAMGTVESRDGVLRLTGAAAP
jgi:hypothetical protein